MGGSFELPVDAVARYRAGESVAALARDLGVSREVMTSRLRASGVAIRPQRKSIDADEIFARYQAGDSMYTLARDFGVDLSTVRRRLVAAGIPIRAASGSSRTGPRRAAAGGARRPPPRDELVARFELGETMVTMARSCGVERRDVERWLKAAGIPITWRPPPAARVALIVERVEAGESIEAIAYDLGIRTSTVAYRVRTAGLEGAEPGRPDTRPDARPDARPEPPAEHDRATPRSGASAAAPVAPALSRPSWIPLAALKARYEAGESVAEIARELGIGPQDVSSRLRAAGVAIRHGGTRPAKALDRELVVARYQGGDSVKSIARDLRVDRHRVTDELRAAGVAIRRSSSPSAVSIDRELVVARYLAGESVRRIARDLRADHHRVADELRAAGVTIRVPTSGRAVALDRELIVDRYLAGESMQSIARDLRADHHRVADELRAAGVTIRVRVPTSRPAVALDRELIVDRYQSGESVRSIAHDLRADHHRVADELRAAGVTIRRRGRRPKEALDRAVVVARYRAGESVAAIAADLKVGNDTVSRAVRAAGEAFREGDLPALPVPVESVAARYERGESLRSIARDLQVDHHRVAEHLRAAGVTIRRTAGVPVEQVVARFRLGESVDAIAADVGVTADTIKRKLRTAGVKFPAAPKRARVERVERVERRQEVVARYQRGESVLEIAAAMRIGKRTVWAHLREAGVPTRDGRAKGVDRDEVVARYGAGDSIYAIAAALDVNVSTVRWHVRAAGVPLRPPATEVAAAAADHAVRLWRDGRIDEEIAAATGRTKGWVANTRQRLGLPPNRPEGQLTLAEAGAALGVSKQRAHQLVLAGRLARHPAGGVTAVSVRRYGGTTVGEVT